MVPPSWRLRGQRDVQGRTAQNLCPVTPKATLSKPVRLDRSRFGLARRSALRSGTDDDHRATLFVQHHVPIFGDGRVRPLEKPCAVCPRQVNTTVTAPSAELVVPVRTVQGVPLVKVLHERYVSQTERIGLVFVS